MLAGMAPWPAAPAAGPAAREAGGGSMTAPRRTPAAGQWLCERPVLDVGPEAFSARLAIEPRLLRVIKGFLLYDADAYPHGFLLGNVAAAASLPVAATLSILDIGVAAPSRVPGARVPTVVMPGQLVFPLHRQLPVNFVARAQRFYSLWRDDDDVEEYADASLEAGGHADGAVSPVVFVASLARGPGVSPLTLRCCAYVPGVRITIHQVVPLSLTTAAGLAVTAAAGRADASFVRGLVVRDTGGRLVCCRARDARTLGRNLVGVWCGTGAEPLAALSSQPLLVTALRFFFTHIAAPVERAAQADPAARSRPAMPSFLLVIFGAGATCAHFEVRVTSTDATGSWRMHDVSHTISERPADASGPALDDSDVDGEWSDSEGGSILEAAARRDGANNYDEEGDDDDDEWTDREPASFTSPFHGDAHSLDSLAAPAHSLYDPQRYAPRREMP